MLSSHMSNQIEKLMKQDHLEYAYLYDFDLILKKIKMLTALFDQRIYLDPSFFPTTHAARLICQNTDATFLCSNANQFQRLEDIGVQSNRKMKISKPSQQPHERSAHVLLVDKNDAAAETFVYLIDVNHLEAEESKLTKVVDSQIKQHVIFRFSNLSWEQFESKREEMLNFFSRLKQKIGVDIGLDLTSLIFEKSCFFAFQVIYTKQNHGHNYAICTAGTNVLYAAGQGMNPRRHRYKIQPLLEASAFPTEEWTFTGPLCTPGDVLAIRYPSIRPQSGAYFYTVCDRFEAHYSPTQFISHPFPPEYYLFQNSIHMEIV